jgi:hypothetical protein
MLTFLYLAHAGSCFVLLLLLAPFHHLCLQKPPAWFWRNYWLLVVVLSLIVAVSSVELWSATSGGAK